MISIIVSLSFLAPWLPPNIKTIGRESVLGSGNIVITPQTAFTVDNRVLSVAEHDGFYWQGKKNSERHNVLWLGTSIPSGEEGSTHNYPTLVGEKLGWNVYNNAKAGSFMFCYPVSSNITDSMSNWDTADNVDAAGFVFGYSLTQTHAEVETMFRNKLNQHKPKVAKPLQPYRTKSELSMSHDTTGRRRK